MTTRPRSLLFLGPRADVRERASPVDAGVRPEVDEDDLPLQAGGREWLRMQPGGGAVERRKSLNGATAGAIGGATGLSSCTVSRPRHEQAAKVAKSSGRLRPPAACACGRCSSSLWECSLCSRCSRAVVPCAPRNLPFPERGGALDCAGHLDLSDIESSRSGARGLLLRYRRRPERRRPLGRSCWIFIPVALCAGATSIVRRAESFGSRAEDGERQTTPISTSGPDA